MKGTQLAMFDLRGYGCTHAPTILVGKIVDSKIATATGNRTIYRVTRRCACSQLFITTYQTE